MRSSGSWAIIAVIACSMTFCLLLLPGCGQAEEGFQIEKLEVTIEADPANELLDMTAFLHIRRDKSIENTISDF
jgi:hypothetical protein